MQKAIPQGYHRNQMSFVITKKILDEYIPKMKWQKDDMLLDVGCGPGSATVHTILERHPTCKKVIGIDESSLMIEFARKTYPKQEYPKTEFKVANIEADPAELSQYSGRFDHVTSFSVLNWMKNQPKALTNIYNMLKPGGDTLHWVQPSNLILEAWKRLFQDPRWLKYAQQILSYGSAYPYFLTMDAAALAKSHMQQSPFKDYTIEQRDETFIHESDVFKDISVSVNPFFNENIIPANEQELFMDDFMKEVQKMGRIQKDGTILDIVKVMVIFAKKP